MKELKIVGQVIAAIAYTCLFTGLMYMLFMLPLSWLLTLKPVILILVLVIFGGLMQFVFFGLQTILLMPYSWIVKDNKVSFWISVALIIFNLIRSDVMVWKSLLGNGVSAVAIALIITALIIEIIIFSIIGILKFTDD